MPRVFAAALLTTIVVGFPTPSMAQRYCQPCQPYQRHCPPSYQHQHQATPTPSEPDPDRDLPAPEPSLDGSDDSQTRPDAPSQFDPADQPQQTQPTFNPSQPTTAATSAQSLAPNSIGDFFGTGGSSFFLGLGPSAMIVAPNAAAAGGNVGRQKFGENVSPIPQDRVFLNYSLFTNVPITGAGTDVNRFTPGIEKTFQDGNMSIELRAPFASTADSTFLSDGMANQGEFEWGDLTVFLKALLYDTETYAITAGVGMSFPTHDPFVVLDTATGLPVIKVESNGIHLLPYVAGLWTPNDQLFVQGFAQIDTDLNGNAVFIDDGTGPVEAGRIQDQTYLFLDVTAGYWVYQNPCGTVRGIAPIVELHANRSLSNFDSVSSGTIGIAGDDDLALLNATLGVNLYVNDNMLIQAGYGLPLTGPDEQFDGEFRLSLNWLFGNGGGPSCLCGLH